MPNGGSVVPKVSAKQANKLTPLCKINNSIDLLY